MIAVAQVLAAIMPAITRLIETILSPVRDAEAEKAAILELQNAVNEARLMQYMQSHPH